MDSEVCAEVRADLTYARTKRHPSPHPLNADPHVCNLTQPSHYYLIHSLGSAAWDCVLVCPTHDALKPLIDGLIDINGIY